MIPFNCESCFEVQNIFSISTDPTFKFYSAISSDSIYIFNSQDPQFPQIASYKRTEESIKSQGPNHWLIWIDGTMIAFGTCAGSFFCIKFFNNQFTGSLFTTNVGSVISDVFSYNGLVGVCIIGPKILFVNNIAQIVSTIEVSCQSPFIKCPSIFNENEFAFISNGQLMKCEISQNEIKNSVSMNYKNIGIVCSCKDKFAFSTYEKNIFISINHKAITKTFSVDSGVVYMNFIDNGNSLLIIDQNGVFTLRNFIFNTNYTLSLPDTKTMISSFYDASSKRFFFLDSSYQIRCINFVVINSSFAVGSSFIYSLTKQRVVCEVPNMDHPRRIRSIPSDLYPIRSITINTESAFCIVGRTGISIFTDYSLFYDPDIIPDFNVWINNMLIIISGKKMALFTSELLPIGDIVLSENPNSVYSTSTRMIISFPNKFTVYEFDPSKGETFFEGNNEKKKSKIGAKISFVSVSFNYPGASIARAFILWDSNDVFLHLKNNSLINFRTNKTIWENAHYIWVNQNPQFLCCYKAGSVNIMSTNSMATLPINSMWTTNKTIVHLTSTLQYENIKAIFTDFSLKMMPIFSDDNSKYGTALTTLLEAEDFKTVLSAFLDNLQQENKLAQYYLGLRQLSPSTVVLFLNEMCDEYIYYLSKTDFDFTLYFPEVKASIQSRILMHSNSEILDRILETHKTILQEKEDRFKNFVCEKCIKTGQYIRGCTFANAADFNFCALLSEKKKLFQTSLTKCILTIEKDFFSWGESDRVAALKVVACSFNLVRLNNWALACFLILEDEGKVVSLLSDNVGTLLYAMRYTRDCKNTAYSKFLVDLQIGL